MLNGYKRKIQEFDSFIGKQNSINPEILNQIHDLEADIDDAILFTKRRKLPYLMDQQTTSQTLRFLVYHVFTPANGTDKGYFTLHIESIQFKDGEKHFSDQLCQHIDAIKIQIFAKQLLTQQIFEWNESQLIQAIAQANSIQLQIPLDKQCTARCSISVPNCRHFSNDLLRTFLPDLSSDITEMDLCNGILQYIAENKLFSPTDMRYVNCDEVFS